MTSSLGELPPSVRPGRRRMESPSVDGNTIALQAAALLLTKPWIARLPLVDEGAETEAQVGSFTEVCILAVTLRWSGAATGAIASCVIAVPAAAVQ
eukprot:4121548-Amphidinium_carterae.1